jgi:hypothetical protein
MRKLLNGLLLGVAAAAVFASSQAWADGEIQKVRLGGTADYDRLVFDLGPVAADVYSVAGDRYLVEFQAAPPTVDAKTKSKLGALGVKIERTGAGTRVAVDRRGRSVQVFRLGGSGGSGDRVVLDISKQSGMALSMPTDAQRVPERAGTATASTEPSRASSKPMAKTSGPAEQAPLPRVGAGLEELPTYPETAAKAPAPANAASPEEVLVNVRAIDFEGLASEAPSRDDLLNLSLNVGVAENGDLVAPRTDLPVQTLTLRALTGDDRQKGRVGGSLLQQIVERIADEYEERGKYGTRIDISKRDLERLLKEQDGRLVIRISEPAEAGTNG